MHRQFLLTRSLSTVCREISSILFQVISSFVLKVERNLVNLDFNNFGREYENLRILINEIQNIFPYSLLRSFCLENATFIILKPGKIFKHSEIQILFDLFKM